MPLNTQVASHSASERSMRALTMSAGSAPFSVIPAGTNAIEVDQYGHVYIGPNEFMVRNVASPAHSQVVADFMYVADTRRIHVRSLVLTEVGDPVDINLGRYGPNNKYPLADGTGHLSDLTGVTAFTNLGVIRWRGGILDGGAAGSSLQNSSVEMWARSTEDVYDGRAGGQWVVATTPNGAGATIERLWIHQDGRMEIEGDLDHDGAKVGFYGAANVVKQTGVAVTAAGVHAALVNLGLISA